MKELFLPLKNIELTSGTARVNLKDAIAIDEAQIGSIYVTGNNIYGSAGNVTAATVTVETDNLGTIEFTPDEPKKIGTEGHNYFGDEGLLECVVALSLIHI